MLRRAILRIDRLNVPHANIKKVTSGGTREIFTQISPSQFVPKQVIECEFRSFRYVHEKYHSPYDAQPYITGSMPMGAAAGVHAVYHEVMEHVERSHSVLHAPTFQILTNMYPYSRGVVSS
jgi:hypothetical protein